MVIVGWGLRLMVGLAVDDGVTLAAAEIATGTVAVWLMIFGSGEEEDIKGDEAGPFTTAPWAAWQDANPMEMTNNTNQHLGEVLLFRIISDEFYGEILAVIALPSSAASSSVPRGLIWMALLVNSLDGTRFHSSRQVHFSAWQACAIIWRYWS